MKPIATFVTLNIGLDSAKLGRITLTDALERLHNFGLSAQGNYRIETATHEFGEESTLIALVPFVGDPDRLVEELYWIAGELGQDCIAYAYVHEGKLIGGLAGPEVEKWGTFNAQYFLPFDDAIDGESIKAANDNLQQALVAA